MRVSHRSHGGIAHRSSIKRKQRLVVQLPVVQRGDLHEKVMRMLAIIDGPAKSCFTLLEELRVKAMRDGGRFQARHGAQGELPGAERPLSHRHEPVGGEYLVISA